jgi:hypothetical protein
MPTAVITLADLHVGSTYGLWHPDADCDDEGGRHTLNFLQSYIWECWQHATTVWLPEVCGKLERVLFVVGDGVDGVSGKSPLVTDDGNLQIGAAQMILDPVARACSATYMVSGTAFHVGKSGEWDNVLAQRIGAVPEVSGASDGGQSESDGDKGEQGEAKRVRRYARWQLFARVGGVTFDVAHHIGGSQVVSSRASPLLREYNAAAVSCFEDADWPHPDWIIRAHGHLYRILPQETGCSILSLPGWEAKTPYAHKISRGRPFDIGLVVLICDEGRVEPHVKIYKWPSPQVVGIETVPQPALRETVGQRIRAVFGRTK